LDRVRRAGFGDVDICGALCFPPPEGLPRFSQLSVRDGAIDGPRAIAKLARRAGPLNPAAVEVLWNLLARRLPPA
jgi:hypothetical protein